MPDRHPKFEWHYEASNEVASLITRAVMVVTPQTLSSDWCKIEAGAAWGLNKPILAVLRHVAPSQLPGPLASLQARVVETRQQQAEFVHDLHKYFASDDEGSSDD